MDARTAYLQAAVTRWEDAVARIRDLLCYDRSAHFQGDYTDALRDEDAQVRKLTYLLMTAHPMDLYHVFGGVGGCSYGPAYSNIDLMEKVSHLVGHEILDDGEPGLGYLRLDPRTRKWIPCQATDPGAEGYFHRHFEVLREYDPDAEWLCLDNAIAVLEKCIEVRERRAARAIEALKGKGADSLGYSALTHMSKVTESEEIDERKRLVQDILKGKA